MWPLYNGRFMFALKHRSQCFDNSVLFFLFMFYFAKVSLFLIPTKYFTLFFQVAIIFLRSARAFANQKNFTSSPITSESNRLARREVPMRNH